MVARLRVTNILIFLCVLIGAPACTSDRIESINGIVVDQRGDLLKGVEVTAGARTTTTNGVGRYVLQDVSKEDELHFELCGYEAMTGRIPETEPFVLDAELKAVQVKGIVLSNLTGAPLRKAEVQVGKTKTKTNKDGRFEIGPYCEEGSSVIARATGYVPQKVDHLDRGKPARVKLIAGPAATWEQLAEWWSEFNWDKSWAWAMPDSRKYLTKAEYVFDNEQGVERGFQTLGTKIFDVHVGKWTMPACFASQTDFGPKTYKKVASIRNIEYRSGPSGGDASHRAVNHLIYVPKTKRWTWVPLAGCQYTPGGFD